MKPNITCRRINVGIVSVLAASFPLGGIAQTAPSVRERAEALDDIQLQRQGQAQGQQQQGQTRTQQNQGQQGSSSQRSAPNPGQGQVQPGQGQIEQGSPVQSGGSQSATGGQSSGQAGAQSGSSSGGSQAGAQQGGQSSGQVGAQSGSQSGSQQGAQSGGQSTAQAGGQQGAITTLPKNLQDLVDDISQTNASLILLGLQGIASAEDESVMKFAQNLGQQHFEFQTQLSQIANDSLFQPKIQANTQGQFGQRGQGMQWDQQYLQQIMKTEAALARAIEGQGGLIQNQALNQYTQKLLAFARKQAEQAQEISQSLQQGGGGRTTGAGKLDQGSQQAGGTSGGSTGGTVGTQGGGSQSGGSQQ